MEGGCRVGRYPYNAGTTAQIKRQWLCLAEADGIPTDEISYRTERAWVLLDRRVHPTVSIPVELDRDNSDDFVEGIATVFKATVDQVWIDAAYELRDRMFEPTMVDPFRTLTQSFNVFIREQPLDVAFRALTSVPGSTNPMGNYQTF
jgi:hypothetical protein